MPLSKNNLFIFIFFILALTGCGDEIVHDISELDANKIITQLHDVGIGAEKISAREGQWSIRVSSDYAVQAMRYLDSSRTLSPTRSEDSASSLIPSREDQLYRFERQMSRGLEGTLKTLSGVLDARVHLNLPRSESLFGEGKEESPTSGSVLLIVNTAFVTNPAEVTALVSGAAGVARERVSVVVNRTVQVSETSFINSTVPRPANEIVKSPSLSNILVAGLLALVFVTASSMFLGRRFFKKTLVLTSRTG